MKLGTDVEYGLENAAGNAINAARLFRFKEQGTKWQGGFGTDGNSRIFEVRPRPAMTANSVVERIEHLMFKDVQSRLPLGTKVIGGAFHNNDAISCHIHYGMSYKVLTGVAELIHNALAWPVRILFADQKAIEKRLFIAGYGKTGESHGGWYRSYHGAHCEYRVCPNFVVNKKVAQIVFDYALNVLPYVGCFAELSMGDYDNVSDFPFDLQKREIVRNLSLLYNYTKNKSVKNMLELIKQAPIIPPMPNIFELWNKELCQISSKTMLVRMLNFTNDEMLTAYQDRIGNSSLTAIVSSADRQITVFGVSATHPVFIYLSPKLMNKLDFTADSIGVSPTMCKIMCKIQGLFDECFGHYCEKIVKVDDFSNYRDGYSIGIPWAIRTKSEFSDVIADLIMMIAKQVNVTREGE